jgi:hypothetical protein
MSVRSTMAQLILRTRTLIGDPGSLVFTDQQIQDELDQCRHEVSIPQGSLQPKPTWLPGGVLQWLDYFGPPFVEDDVQVLNASFSPLVLSSNDPFVSHFVLGVSVVPPVYMVGRYFDVYRGCVSLLQMWLANLKLEYDFRGEGGIGFSRSQRQRNIQELIKHYTRMIKPRVGRLSRNDLSSGSSLPSSSNLPPWWW